MEGSRLEKLLKQIYQTNTVSHMMSGRAISRAFRVHYLTNSALHMILFDLLMLQNEPSREEFNCRQRRPTVTVIKVLTKQEVMKLKVMYKNLSYTDFNSKRFDMSPLIKLQENLRNFLRCFIKTNKCSNVLGAIYTIHKVDTKDTYCIYKRWHN